MNGRCRSPMQPERSTSFPSQNRQRDDPVRLTWIVDGLKSLVLISMWALWMQSQHPHPVDTAVKNRYNGSSWEAFSKFWSSGDDKVPTFATFATFFLACGRAGGATGFSASCSLGLLGDIGSIRSSRLRLEPTEMSLSEVSTSMTGMPSRSVGFAGAFGTFFAAFFPKRPIFQVLK